MTRRALTARTALLLVLAGVLSGIDLITKHLVFRWLGAPTDPTGIHRWWIWEGYIGFETSLNTGALGGIGQGMVLWFAALSVAAIAGLLYWFLFRGAAEHLGLTLTLGVILGGILGNLYDRLGLWTAPGVPQPCYAVRDWILFRYGDFVWPNFNLADSYLVCGAAVLAWMSLLGSQPLSSESSPGES